MSKIESIKKITITARELDVIACIVGTRGVKKIAAVLDVSPSTVMSHTRNLCAKFSCNSQQGIQNFVETSDEIAWIKNHYIDLLTLYHLRQKLAQIAPQILKYSASCILTQENKEALNNLAEYLKIAKVAIQDEPQSPFNTKETRVLTQEAARALEAGQEFKDVIFICKDQSLAFASVYFQSRNVFDCSSTKMFALSIFKILAILVPNLDFTKQILEFASLQKNIESSNSNQKSNDSVEVVTRKLPSTKYILLAVISTAIIFNTVVWKFFIPHSTTTATVSAQKASNSVTPVSYFVNHTKQVQQIQEYLAEYKKASIVGLSGMGKTQLARMYVRENIDKYDIVWFFDCNLDLNSQFLDLAKAINKTYGASTVPDNVESTKQDVLKYLAPRDKWLLVFDNLKIKDNDKVKDLVEWEHNGDVIFGSQDAQGLPNTLQIGAFVHKDAITLADDILENSDPKTAQFLAAEFKGYPILIVQGAQLLNQIKGLSLNAYKEKIQGAADKIKLNISLAMDELKPDTKDLLQKIALINNQAFSKELLKIISNNPEGVDSDIYDLSKFALISTVDIDSANPVFEMHDVIYNNLQSLNQPALKTKILSDIIDKINAKIPKCSASKYDFFHKDPTLKSSLEVIFQNIEKYQVPLNQTLELTSNLLAIYMLDLDYYNCKKMKNWLVKKEQEQAFDLKTMNNQAKADYARMNLDIAIYEDFANSNFKESLERFKKAEEIMQNIAGYQELKFAILSQTAQIYAWSGDLFNTDQYLLKAQKIIDQNPEADLDKGLFWFIKAKLFMLKGDNDKALEAIDQSLKADANLDQNTSFVAPTYVLKAEILNLQGNYEQAYSIVKKIFDQQIGDKTPDHEMHARILIKLASVEANLGKANIALTHIQQACQIFQNGNTEVNTDYAAALVVQGQVLAQNQQYKEALESYLEAEKIYRNRYQENFGATKDVLSLLSNAVNAASKANDSSSKDRLESLIKSLRSEPD